MTAAKATNSGGRKKFPNGQKVQLLNLLGTIDTHIYMVVPEELPDGEESSEPITEVRADRKGHVPVKRVNGQMSQKVHFRRILPLDSDGKASVIESNDKYRAICPKCGNVFDVVPSDNTITCDTHGEFTLKWLGVKPMSDEKEAAAGTTTAPEAPVAATETATTETAAPTTEKKSRPAKKEPVVVDFAVLKALDGVELWTKKNVKFDHPDVDVQAHVLLLTGDSPRKYCFNTYNNALGKKAKKLYVEEFLANEEVAGSKRSRPWFDVKNIEKERTDLGKKGYEQP